jgi:O-antigen ligase
MKSDTIVADVDNALSTRDRVLDWVLVVGLLAAITFATVEFERFGIGEPGEAATSIKVLQRLSVYLPLSIGLLAGVRAIDVLLRLPLSLFVAFLSWSTVAAAFALEPFGDVERMVWFTSFVLLVVMVAVRLDWERFVLVIGTLGVAYVGGSLAGHVLDLFPAETTEFFESGLFGIGRVTGFAHQPNSLGRVAAFTSLSGLILIVIASRRTSLVMGALAATVGFVGLFASQSRFAIVSLAVAGAILLARRSRRAHLIAVVGGLAVAGVLLSVLLSGTTIGSRSGNDDEFGTLLGRTAVWEEAIDLIVENPVTGIGSEGLQAYYTGWEDAGYANWNPGNAHNLLIQAAAAHGLPGAVLLSLSIIVGFVMCWRSQIAGTVAILTMFVVQGIGEATVQGSPSGAVALFVGALVVATLHSARQSQDE